MYLLPTFLLSFDALKGKVLTCRRLKCNILYLFQHSGVSSCQFYQVKV